MASAFKKFKHLENNSQTAEKNESAEKPQRKKLQTYNHIVSKFESMDGDVRKRIVQERLKQRQEEKEERRKEELRAKQEEEERRRKELEEQEILRKLREEEEERRRAEEELRRKEEEEAARLAEIKRQQEGKYAGLKPAAAMFEKALEAKRSMQRSIKGERVITLRKGTISEIRSKIFDNPRPEEPLVKKAPKKMIIPDKSGKEENDKKEEKNKTSSLNNVPTETKKEEAAKNSEPDKIDTKDNHEKPTIEGNDGKDDKANKRQSFISDFAALEKTYKILGLSIPKEQTATLEEPKQVKKRHNSEGKVKNKDKNRDKVKRKSVVTEPKKPDESPISPPTPPQPVEIEAKLNALDKGRAAERKNFFQTLINEKKGLVKQEPELQGPQMRKRTSLTQSFSKTNEEENKRKSLIKDEIKVDKKQFNSFLDRFESKDQRAEAKNQILKITKQQKEFEKRKQKQEEEQRKLAEKQRLKEEEMARREREIQAAIEEEARQLQIQEAKEAELRQRELEKELKQEEDDKSLKRKVIKKKKKPKPDEEDETLKDAPKLNIAVNNYNDVKSKFERKRSENKQPLASAGPSKTQKINKLTNNPFLENTNVNTAEEKPTRQGVKVNKLQKNAFMRELEKNAAATEEAQKPEPRLKKISSEAHIKFESKKEKVHHDNETNEEVNDKKVQVHISKSIEGQNPKKKSSKDKTSSSLSLHKIFIDGPKEFFRSSKEKLYKLSKENLYEVDKPVEPEKTREQKLSKSEMQNYLLSHVLFDGNDVKKKDKAKKDEDDIDKYLDQEYKDRINQYCTLLEEDKQQQKKRKKKKKKSEEKKVEEKQPLMKMVDIKSRQQQLFQQQNQSAEKTSKDDAAIFSKNESKVNKFKEMFDNDKEPQTEERIVRGQENRRSKVKSDIFSKIQALELAEQERLEREKATEERMKKLLQLEMERRKDDQTEENELNEDVEEQNLKNNILQCLEDEVQNLEQEMLALETEEKLILEEEAEDTAELEVNEDHENEMELEEHINQLHEIQNEIEERKEMAANKRKVLERFQHVLDNEKDENDSKGGVKVGSIKDRLANFLDNKESKSVRSFDESESVFVGVSDTMSKFKSKLESQEEEEAPLLFSRDEIKRKPNSTAMKFEMMKYEEEEEVLSPKSPAVNKEWNWKKKTAEELHAEVDGPKVKTEEKESRKSHSFQDTKFNELLADISAVKQRLNERDVRWQEKENERKLLEMEEAIKEVQEVLKSKEDDSEDSDSDSESVRRPVRKRKVTRVEDKSAAVSTVTHNKIGELKSQLLSMINEETQEKSVKKDNIAVNISELKERITLQDDIPLPHSKAKESIKPSKSQSSGLVLQLAEKLSAPEDKDYEDVPLTKAPKRLLKLDNMFEDEEQPAKTLEELKEANQKKKWAWKEKEMTELQDLMAAYEDVAPHKLKDQHKKLKDLEEEQKVVESLTRDKDTAILVQIREEKEKEFDNFMNEIHSYLAEGTKDAEEIELKKGMKDYLDLISEDTKKKRDEIKLPKVQLNTVSKLKTSLFEENDDIPLKKSSPKVKKLNKEKLEKEFSENDFKKTARTVSENITTEGISSVKRLYEKRKEEQEEVRPMERRKTDTVSIVEKMRRKAIEEKERRLAHQLQYKLKTVMELHDYIQNHESLATDRISYASRTFRVSKETEKLSCHTDFMETLTEYLGQPGNSEEQTIFRCNIQAYLSILNNVGSIYNATPKLKKHNGSDNLTKSNMKKAILEKSYERPQKSAQAPSVPQPKPEERILSPEEKRKEILSKYGFKDRSQIVIQELSDDSDSSESEEEVDIKKLTDKELSEKYGLPYIEVAEEESIVKSESAVGITSLLSKIRSLQGEKTDSVKATKDVFERRRPSDGVVKSDSMARMRKLFDSPTNSGRSSPAPNFETSNHVTMRMKKRFEEAPVERKSWTFENDEIRKSGSTSRMRQRFENDSPSNSRSGSPLLRNEPGTMMTSKMKRVFEENAAAAGPKRNSLVGDEALSLGSTTKLKDMFEATKSRQEPTTPLSRNRGIVRSSTLSTMSNESPAMKNKLVENFFSQERNKPSLMQSPVMKRPSLEKCKSMSKIKDAFEFGKGLNDETEAVQNLESRKSIHAELELLRSPSSKEISTPRQERKDQPSERRDSPAENSKANLVAAFFSPDSRGRSSSMSSDKPKIMREPKQDSLKNERRQINSEIKNLSNQGNPQNILKPSTQTGFNSVQKSSTVSDIGSYLKYKFEDQPAKTLPSPKPERLAEKMLNSFSQRQEEDPPSTPLLQRGVEKSRSFSKFKNAFEDGVGIMDASEAVDADKHRVNAELNALKSSNKIQNMFRINKSKSSANNSPKMDHMDLDEKVMEDVGKSRSNITSMFESLGPKMKFGGGTPKTEKPDPPKPKAAPQKPEEGELQGRKWVFDTIQKYFDVIVEEGEEEEEEEEEGEVEGEDEGNASESESDYTSAEDEIPEVVLPPVTGKVPNRTLTSAPSYSLPARRAAGGNRANTGNKW